MYIWMRDTDEKNYTRTTMLDDAPTYFFKECRQTINSGTIKDEFYPVKVWAKEDPQKISDYFISNGMYIVSKRLKELLEDENVESTVEFFPLEIVAGKRKKIAVPSESYFLMNFLGDIDCFDLEKSVYQRVDEWTVRNVEKLCLHESKIPSEAKLFLIFPYIFNIGIQDDLAEKILQGKFKGIKLTRVEESKIL